MNESGDLKIRMPAKMCAKWNDYWLSHTERL